MSDPNLTEALAQKNPKAYAARFKRLSPGERSSFERQLTPSFFFHHERALGQTPAVAVFVALDRTGALDWLELRFGGLQVRRDKQGWPDARATLDQLLAGLPTEVGVSATLMLPTEPPAVLPLFDTALKTMGWQVTDAHFSTSDPSDEGRVRFAFADGVVTLVGTTGRGELRGHACVPQGAVAAAESAWNALASRVGLRWQRS